MIWIMSLTLFRALAAFIILAISFLTGWKPLRTARAKGDNRLLDFGEALAGGVFLGIGLFHMLPDAERALRTLYPNSAYPYANLVCGLGFVALLFLEKVVLQSSGGSKHKHS